MNPSRKAQQTKIVALHCKTHIRLEIELSGRLRKNLSEELGVDQAQLSRWEAENYPATFPIHLLPAWTRYVGPGLLEYLAREAGYELKPMEHLAHLDAAGM